MKILIKDYTINYKDYGEITVPKGTKTDNNTATGIDLNHNFIRDYHDVYYYGINVPNDYLTPLKTDRCI